MFIKLKRDEGIGKLLVEWHQKLDDNPADRAILRRAADLTQVAISAPYQRLYQRMAVIDKRVQRLQRHHLDPLAAAVGLLAHVKVDAPGPVAEAMSTPLEKSSPPPVSELRFSRLLQAPDIESLFMSLRRTLPLIKHRVDIVALSQDVLHWGDAVKKQWAYAYQWPTKQ